MRCLLCVESEIKYSFVPFTGYRTSNEFLPLVIASAKHAPSPHSSSFFFPVCCTVEDVSVLFKPNQKLISSYNFARTRQREREGDRGVPLGLKGNFNLRRRVI